MEISKIEAKFLAGMMNNIIEYIEGSYPNEKIVANKEVKKLIKKMEDYGNN